MDGRSLSDISGVPEPVSRELIVPRSHDLAKRYIHKGQYRLTGEPFIRHPERLEKLASDVLQDTEFKTSARASALVHEGAEDSNIIIFDQQPCLYNFYSQVEEEGKRICYIVDKLTHKKGTIRYIVYMHQIFNLAPSGETRDLDIITLAMKILDRYENTNPRQRIKKDHYREEFREFKGQGREQELIEKYKISEYIRPGKKLTADMLISSVEEKIVRKLLVNAIDNIGPYLPRIEYAYPYLWAAERVLFEDLGESDKRLFYPYAMKEIKEECECNSDIIIKKYRDRFKMEWIGDLGYFRK